MSDYWREAVEIALNDTGVVATDKQVDDIAGSIEISHENYGMAHGHDVASANYSAARQREIDEAWRAVERERNKVHCRVCDGTGWITTSYGTMSATSQCWKCRGDGRHDP